MSAQTTGKKPASWEISGPHSCTQAANEGYCGTCNQPIPLGGIVDHWLKFQTPTTTAAS